MWERLRQALSNFFMTEVVVEEEPELKSRNASEQKVQKQYQTNQQPQAKMAYTYPKERAFRFPMIPDESRNTKPPASNVRPVRHRAQQDSKIPEKRQPRQPEKPKVQERPSSANWQRQPERKEPEPKIEKKPFQPTEVPSPVYGFRKRKEEVADIVTLASIQDRADWKRIAASATTVSPEVEEEKKFDIHVEQAPVEDNRLENPITESIEQMDITTAEFDNKETLLEETNVSVEEEEDIEEISVSESMEVLEAEPIKLEEEPASREEEIALDQPADIEETASNKTADNMAEDIVLEQSIDLIEEDDAPDLEAESKAEDEVNDLTAEEAVPEAVVDSAAEKTAPNQTTELEKTDDSVVQADDSGIETVQSAEQTEEKEVLQAKESAETSNSRIRDTSSTVRKSVPFNVFMTPRDKRSNLQENKLSSRQDSQKTEPVEQEIIKQTEPSFARPPMHLLNDPVEQTIENDAWVDQQSQLLETTLQHFNVNAHVVNAMQGPSVTRFEVQPDLGVKVSKIKSLTDDIKLNMAAKDIRMEAPIPGKNAIGIEVPNAESKQVGLQEILETEDFQDNSSPLSVGLGLNISGNPIVTNLQKMPHGLIAGATGSGKSVCINTILLSLLYKANHKQVKFLLIDPKMVELAPYNDLPHLVSPVITDTKAATAALKWAVNEMEERYMKFVGEGVRDIGRYNEKLDKQGRYADKMPYLVIVIDELADLMMVAPQDVEDSICRIAQKARAAGIHLLLATQRPSVDVITGLIKANIPTRIAFSVSSAIDSRTIIDNNGAEKLLGKGDMLFIENGARQAQRIQGAFVSDEEIERVVQYVKQTAPPEYLFQHEDLLERRESEEDEDELYREAVEFVIEHNSASASLLQRRFKIGYNRAARLIDHMEMRGVISEQKGSKPRDVLVSLAQLQTE
ncbi:DNA translocase FtsK [Terribacillus saccharophilus]|uniref:DNA translocase FtsK n=1 Tax=Terribacillus saccharophilus TaxID=361277 RepID=UPI002DD229BD|nr:DNA translocase FtsK [Terribacillus saccharophilus]MEC0290937.1 DNA translocase FtsK [Terribacillus saccharophilus]